MPKLLISVRSPQEAGVALAAGVDLIDIKEPAAGPLGRASSATIDEILRLIHRRRPTSVACGELLDAADDVVGNFQASGSMSRPADGRWPDYVKVGFSGCGAIDDWRQRWRHFATLLPLQSIPVAVVYADWQTAKAPPPDQLIDEASSTVLIDTFDKSGPGLLRIHTLAAIGHWIEEVHIREMQIVVAGQLTLEDAIAVASLEPDYVGVRGGVCRPNRNGDLDLERLVEWRSRIADTHQAPLI